MVLTTITKFIKQVKDKNVSQDLKLTNIFPQQVLIQNFPLFYSNKNCSVKESATVNGSLSP